MSVLVQVAMFPIGESENVSSYVARVVGLIKNSGLPYTFGPMGTAIEGEWSEVMELLTRCHHELEKDCGRIYMSINIDSRKGRQNGMKQKIQSVDRKLADQESQTSAT